ACFLAVELGELLALLAAERPGRSPPLRLLSAQLVAAEPVVDVGPPGAEIDRAAHRLAELAIIDDVDAAGGLAADHVRNCGSQARQELVVRRVVPVECDEIGRPRQAADVGGENAVSAALHGIDSRPQSSPQLARGELCALAQRGELRPGD